MWQYYCLTRGPTFSTNRLGIAETGSKPSSELAARMLVIGCPSGISLRKEVVRTTQRLKGSGEGTSQ